MATMINILSSLFCFISLISLLFSTSQTISQRDPHMRTFCSLFSDNFTRTSTYAANRESVLSSLRLRSPLGTYSNATSGISPDTVHGMYLCRGDITRTSCSDCVQTAALEIAKNCTYQKEGFIFYEGCMVRYSDYSFFTLQEDRPLIIRYYSSSAFNSDTFPQALSDKMDDLIIKASSSSSYFVEDQERMALLGGSYYLNSIVQCSPDLESRNCTGCLKLAAKEILDCCNQSVRAQIFTPKCLLRYEVTALASPPPPPSPSFLPPSPPFFSRPPYVPSISGSFSINVIRRNGVFGNLFTAVMTAMCVSIFG
ncbi:unnamed protein product [Eruca vesicaria subsp. sativa]|uniref:Gnk2-homologous domain-containing protein n=1 Tax=Eruca vesicaria subsp. sativa TaxID=29727 RepID=A0ABC8LG78_ERUVS|nr:unnamed protein product [Eruca vesicaria subsp. sativa]